MNKLSWQVVFIMGVILGSLVVGGFWLSTSLKDINDDKLTEEKTTEKDTSENSEEDSDLDNIEDIDVGISVGDEAPDFTLPMFTEDEEVSLKDFLGKKVLLNFFVSWCPYCQDETPYLEEIQEKYGDDVQVLMINLAIGEESADDVDEFIDKFKVKNPVLVDYMGEVGDTYRVQATPTNYFINREGVIEEMIPGAISYEEIEEILNNID